ncbi:MAG TPA: tRNA adenosine(34) deaminase TadA, partial [Oscillatoriaceae cyanobacterium]
RLALAQAEVALAAGDVPVGALVVCDGEIVAQGHNTREARLDPTGHAELNVLRQAAAALGRWRLNGCTLYVTLEPCPMCAAAIAQARIERVVYGALDPKQGAAGTVFNLVDDSRLNHRVEAIAGVLESDCAALLTRFFRERDSGR